MSWTKEGATGTFNHSPSVRSIDPGKSEVGMGSARRRTVLRDWILNLWGVMLLTSPGSIRIWVIGVTGRKTHRHTPELDVELGSLVSATSVNRLSKANNGESYSNWIQQYGDWPSHITGRAEGGLRQGHISILATPYQWQWKLKLLTPNKRKQRNLCPRHGI